MTELGLSIGPIYKAIHQWQQKHIKEIEKSREEYDVPSQ
ncbi:MAG: hypothetical protein KZQ85_14970 [Candidatus Thiodiazotropha sp. (ex Myrtea sp. 'scaly one' KF741663)]|nr:hypothetical protein [Candidatus Thiodiazotropha sp. (ex Myrtea sp. 'scaly one' KF741663)]